MSDKRVRYVLTCGACPEQYDCYIDGEDTPSGYLRLRHGSFRAEYNGTTVYTASPQGDGLFESHERDFYLEKAAQALLEAHDEYSRVVENKSFYIDGDEAKDWGDY